MVITTAPIERMQSRQTLLVSYLGSMINSREALVHNGSRDLCITTAHGPLSNTWKTPRVRTTTQQYNNRWHITMDCRMRVQTQQAVYGQTATNVETNTTNVAQHGGSSAAITVTVCLPRLAHNKRGPLYARNIDRYTSWRVTYLISSLPCEHESHTRGARELCYVDAVLRQKTSEAMPPKCFCDVSVVLEIAPTSVFPAQQAPSVGVPEGFSCMLGSGTYCNLRWFSTACSTPAAIARLLGCSPCFVAELSRRTTSPVYTLRPDSSQPPPDHPHLPEIVAHSPTGAGGAIPALVLYTGGAGRVFYV